MLSTQAPRSGSSKSRKKGTEPSAKLHRFVTFSQRIANLKIDPVHRVRRNSFNEENGDQTYSHFRASLEHWAELNLSENFTEFSRLTGRLCESLPQVLYHQEKIAKLLVEYIGRKDELSMEPLLSLMAQFARDLGSKFEEHFPTAVQLVASIAAIHTNVEVIEWSFTCLAWMFKFLSRLLVPDLRQLLGIMSPYLGKSPQKYFVTRFAAESMSFLIRKAALVYYKNKAPLNWAVSFLIEDVSKTETQEQTERYQEGLMTMLSDAMKGVKGGFHSNGADILRCLIGFTVTEEEASRAVGENVLCGVLVNLAHYSTPDTFLPILDVICDHIETPTATTSNSRFRLDIRLICLCIVTRKGSRIPNWKRVHKVLLKLLKETARRPQTSDATETLLAATAMAIQTSPMDELLPFMRQIMETLISDPLSSHFLPFCLLLAESGSERFHSIILPYFQRFIVSFWKNYEAGFCLALPRLQALNCVTSQLHKPGYLSCPVAWKDVVKERFSSRHPAIDEVALLHAYTTLHNAISFSSPPSIASDIFENLRQLVRSAMDSRLTDQIDLDSFACGQGFLSYVQFASQFEQIDGDMWRIVMSRGVQCAHLLLFLEATLQLLNAYSSSPPEFSEPDIQPFVDSLLDNLASPSHDLRSVSLKILRAFLRLFKVEDPCVDIAIDIEDAELGLETEREVLRQIRLLAINYSKASEIKWLGRLIANFCFGLLSKRLNSVWNEVCEALKIICQTAVGESVVIELAMKWLQDNTNLQTSEVEDIYSSEESPSSASEFQCSDVVKFEKKLAACFKRARTSELLLIEEFRKAHRSVTMTPVNARSQALRVLAAVPHLAEKRSRQIVPLFLSWASKHDETSPQFTPALSGIGVEAGSKTRWEMSEKKAMLGLFGLFTNPKVLYKSSEVLDALATLLCNGDPDIQKPTLKAIFAWKFPAIKPYEQNLLNLLDAARFKDELMLFINVGNDNSVIEEEHREDLMPYLFRLLYGKMVSRSGLRSSQVGGQEGRRKTVLRLISQLPNNDFERFVDIVFGTLGTVQVLEETSQNENILSQELLGIRKQNGLLKMIETMYSTLKGKMSPYVDRTMNILLYCLIRACRQLQGSQEITDTTAHIDSKISILRNLRHTGIRCLDLVFSVSQEKDWSAYMPMIFSEIIDPRLQNFAVETAQGVSGFLQIFRTWAVHPKSALNLSFSGVVPKVADILNVESARDEVKLFVLNEILRGLINSATNAKAGKDGDVDIEATSLVQTRILAPYVEHILVQLDSMLRKQPSRQLTVAGVDVFSKLAQFVESSTETSELINTTMYLLKQPPDRVPPKTKGSLLRFLQHFLPLYKPEGNDELNQQMFEVLSSMFDYFKDDANREALSTVFSLFSSKDTELIEVSKLAADLNSISIKRLDEMDFERRLAAFHVINEQKHSVFSARQWRPLLYNLLYHIKDEEELAIRSSASLGLRRFIQYATREADAEGIGFRQLLDTVLLPSLKSGMKQRPETVRVEFVAVFGYLIQQCPHHPAINDLHDLLANGDEEASFFTNILHIQQHRRQRALRRLATEVSNGKISATNISTVFFPLIEHYVFNQAEDENAHNLAAETVSTLGVLTGGLEWNQFKATFRRFRDYLRSKPGMEKSVIRLLGQLTDTLTLACQSKQNYNTTKEVSDEILLNTLSRSIPGAENVTFELKTHFIPFLSQFIRHKEESEVSLRLPVAITTIKLLKLLPEKDRNLFLPPILLDISNVLKSKSQDSRDVARKTLTDIALILGPAYFGYIVKELRTALSKGYQLHVLSYTVHSILVTVSEQFKPGDLDEDLPALASVIMDDIFGTVGQEKDAEGYVSKMKEVKANKSFDSMELLAKNTSIRHAYSLVRPIQQLLEERLTSTIVKKVDELFKRIATGLLRNPGAESRDFLIFCYQVIKESYKQGDVSQAESSREPKDRFIVKMIAFNKSGTGRSTSSYLYKLARFGMDTLRSVLNKHTSILIAKNLGGFLPIIGDAIVQGYEEVKIAAIRLLATIIKLPLEELDANSETYLIEAIKLVKEAPTTNSEGAQAAIKLIASILRERRNTTMKDSHLAYLLKRVSGDIEEPDRQGITFNFIRAVMARKFLVPEMYELMDNIAVMMVTNHTRNARDLARGVYVHFLIEYPQTKNRWSKQLGYLAKNLDYRHKEGRQSVLEAVHLLLTKTNGELAQDIVGTFFAPVVMVMANDESPECREMAGVLLNNLFRRAESEQLKSIVQLLRTWLERIDNLSLVGIGLQATRIFFESELPNQETEVKFVANILPRLMNLSLENQSSEEWETLYYSLQLFIKLSKLYPSLALSQDCSPIWSKIRQCLYFPHAWIKSCATNLIGIWFADEGRANATNGLGCIPLVGSAGLELDDSAMLEITRGCVYCLKASTITEELATQTIRNLVFLGRCFGQNNLLLPRKVDGTPGADDVSDLESENEENSFEQNDQITAIQYIFEQAARILRRQPLTTKADSLIAKSTSMKLIAALCSHLETTQVLPSLQKLLVPMLHLTDPSIPAPNSTDEGFQTTYKSLVSSSQEILDLLQKKLGTTEFVAELSRAREGVKSRRDERRVKRKIEAVADPEKFGRDKKRKNERKKDKRKEKGLSFRDRRRGW